MIGTQDSLSKHSYLNLSTCVLLCIKFLWDILNVYADLRSKNVSRKEGATLEKKLLKWIVFILPLLNRPKMAGIFPNNFGWFLWSILKKPARNFRINLFLNLNFRKKYFFQLLFNFFVWIKIDPNVSPPPPPSPFFFASYVTPSYWKFVGIICRNFIFSVTDKYSLSDICFY